MLTIPQAQQDQGRNASEGHREKQDAPTTKSVHGDPQEDTGQGRCAAGQQGAQVEVRWAPCSSHRLVAVGNGVGNEAVRKGGKQRTVSESPAPACPRPQSSVGPLPPLSQLPSQLLAWPWALTRRLTW